MKTPNSFLPQEDSTVTFQVQAREHLGFLLGRDRAMKPPTQKPALTQHRKLFQIQWVGAEGGTEHPGDSDHASSPRKLSPGDLGPNPMLTLPPPQPLNPCPSPKAKSYSCLFLKDAFETMSPFFPFPGLGMVYFKHLLFSMSCECHCEASLSWTVSMVGGGGCKAGPTVKNTPPLHSPLKTRPQGAFCNC